MKLNKQQAEAVKADGSRVLVVAGAGAGKTRVLTERVAELISRGHSPSTILALTFTRKAASEMKERLSSMMPERDAKRLTVSTFHALCLRIVRETGEVIGYRPNLSIDDELDRQDVIKMVTTNLGYKLSTKKVVACLEAQDQGNEPPELDAPESEQVRLVADEYRSNLRQYNALDYGGLIAQAVKILEEFPQAQRHYASIWRHILVDEFQDTDELQVRFLRVLDPETLFMVGDYRQSIYQWRGARPDLLMEFADHPSTSRYDLNLNYRSLPDILALANAVIQDEDDRYGQPLQAVRVAEAGVGVQVETRVDSGLLLEGLRIVNTIVELVEHGYHYRDIVILARTNRTLEAFSRWLTDSGLDEDVPHIRIGKRQRLWKREEIRLCIRILRLLHNPWDNQALLSIMKTLSLEVPDIKMAEYYARKDNKPLLQYLAYGKFEQFFKQFLDFYEIVLEYAAHDHLPAAGALADAGVAFDLIEHYGHRGLSSREANINWLNNWLFDNGMTVQEFLDWRASADLQDELGECEGENVVRLMTVHTAKGLEFPVVFALGLTEGDFPHRRGELDEETRLFYVAATRAADKLFLSCSLTDEYGKEKRPSRFMPVPGGHDA